MFVTKRALLRTLERERIAFAAERRDLLNRIMLLAGKPYELPPIEPTVIDDEPDTDWLPDVDQYPE